MRLRGQSRSLIASMLVPPEFALHLTAQFLAGLVKFLHMLGGVLEKLIRAIFGFSLCHEKKMRATAR